MLKAISWFGFLTYPIPLVLQPTFSKCLWATPATGKHFPEYQAPGNLIRLAAMTPVTKDADVKLTYNDNEYMASGAPVAVNFEYGLVNDFLLEWNEMKNKLKTGETTPNE